MDADVIVVGAGDAGLWGRAACSSTTIRAARRDRRVSHAAQEIAASAQTLSSTAQELNALVSRFKVEA